MTINTTIPTQEETKRRARRLRRRQTKAEQMLWDVLRAKRLCGLKFRRQHPIDPFIADFACVARKAIVELDGGYRDYQYEDDDSRKAFLEEQGWFVMRFSNDEVIENIDAVAVSIAKQLELVPKFGERRRASSGMMCDERPSPGLTARPLPQVGEVRETLRPKT